jgi:hypothetical protein
MESLITSGSEKSESNRFENWRSQLVFDRPVCLGQFSRSRLFIQNSQSGFSCWKRPGGLPVGLESSELALLAAFRKDSQALCGAGSCVAGPCASGVDGDLGIFVVNTDSDAQNFKENIGLA